MNYSDIRPRLSSSISIIKERTLDCVLGKHEDGYKNQAELKAPLMMHGVVHSKKTNDGLEVGHHGKNIVILSFTRVAKEERIINGVSFVGADGVADEIVKKNGK